MSLTFFELSLAALVFLISYIYLQYRKTYSFWSSRGVKGPIPLPLFGNSLSYFFFNYRDVDEANCKKFGKTYGIYEGSRPVLITSEQSIIQEIWISSFTNFGRTMEVHSPDPIDTNMINNVVGDDWKRVRNVFTTTFSTSRIKEATRKSEALLDKFFIFLEDLVTKEKVLNGRDLFSHLMLDVITQTFYSMQADIYGANKMFMEKAQKMFRFYALEHFLLATLPLWASQKLGLGFSSADSAAYFKEIIVQVAKDRSRDGNPGQRDMLQLLLEAKDEDAIAKNKGLLELEVMGNAVVLLGGAFDAMTTTMTFMAWRLAQNPSIQEKVHEEVVGVLGVELTKPVSYDDTKEMPYLEAALNETLRINALAFRNLRVATADSIIPGTDIQIPKGTYVQASTYLLHYDPELYSDPHLFKPERFLNTAEERIRNGSFIPFGLGPRQCVAMRFALASLKQCVAEIIRRYEFVPADNFAELVYPKGTIMVNETVVEFKMIKRSS